MDKIFKTESYPSDTEKEEKSSGNKFATFLKQDGLTVLIVLLLVMAYALLRTSGDTFESLEILQASFQNTQPTVIEFYSNNCSICLVSKPKVVQMEQDLKETARFLKLNVKEPVSQALANKWGVRGVPTFIILDPSGDIVYTQAGAPDNDEIIDFVNEIVQ
jgi:thiol-disulfide isomerase/thioredoxin